jgi:hypothetical protein
VGNGSAKSNEAEKSKTQTRSSKPANMEKND